MAKKLLVEEEIQLHDMMAVLKKNDNVMVYDIENKPLFDIDEYYSVMTLIPLYGEKTVKEVRNTAERIEVQVWY